MNYPESVISFLQSNRISVLTTLLPDGSPHGATLHYSHSTDPLELYFSTENTSRKCQNLMGGKFSKASVVIGFSEQEWKTLQMDGEIQAVLDKSELEKVHKVHYAKHPNSEQYKNDPATVFLKFTPKWWRYTDYNTTPETKLSPV